MQPSISGTERRNLNRVRAVLPVRVRGTDEEGRPFEDIAHTLDITATGSRVAAIHHRLRVEDHVTVVYRQWRMEFSVVWIKAIGKHEFQVGLQTVSQQTDAWGLKASDLGAHVPHSGSVAKLAEGREALQSREHL
jgi:hypothetical protein